VKDSIPGFVNFAVILPERLDPVVFGETENWMEKVPVAEVMLIQGALGVADVRGPQ
jgi:hypothetical protein